MRARILTGLLLVATACTSSDGGVAVVEAWARPTAPEADVAAFYVDIRNDGPDEVLVGAQSDRCGAVALHDTVLEDGVMTMRHIEEVAIDGGSTLTMEPGGLHIMCVDLEESLVAGQHVDLVLLLGYAVRLEIAVSVEQR